MCCFLYTSTCVLPHRGILNYTNFIHTINIASFCMPDVTRKFVHFGTNVPWVYKCSVGGIRSPLTFLLNRLAEDWCQKVDMLSHNATETTGNGHDFDHNLK